MKNFFILIIIVVFLSCNNNNSYQNVKGVLFIKLIDYGSSYGVTEDKKQEFLKLFDIIRNKHKSESITENDSLFIEYYSFLIENDLLDKPHFKMLSNNKDTLDVFCDEQSYLKLEKLIKTLDRDRKKIEIEFEGKELKKNLYYTKNFKYVSLKDGRTPWAK